MGGDRDGVDGDQPMRRERRVEVQGRSVRVVELGRRERATPLVLIPGLGLSSDFYAGTLERLAGDGFRVITPDPPGFGRSRAHGWTGLPVEAWTRWLIAFADTLRVDTAVWIGHSVSCHPLMELAIHRPERVRGLVLAAPTGLYGWRRAPAEVVNLARDALREPLSLLAGIARDYIRTSPLRYAGTWLRSTGHRPLRHAPRVRAPTLVVCGQRDPVVPPALGRELVARLPAGRLALCPTGAHGLPVDAPDEFTAVTAEFARLLTPGAAS